MAEILIWTVIALAVLAGLSVYSALRLAKRTDEMVSTTEARPVTEAPLVVHFPESVFAPRARTEATHKQG